MRDTGRSGFKPSPFRSGAPIATRKNRGASLIRLHLFLKGIFARGIHLCPEAERAGWLIARAGSAVKLIALDDEKSSDCIDGWDGVADWHRHDHFAGAGDCRNPV